jgi:phage protein U
MTKGENLKSALDVKVMMILGKYRFCISNSAYKSLSRTSEYSWAEHNRIANESALQFTGKKSESITLQGTIYPHFKGGLNQVNSMRDEASKGKALMLIAGNGNVFGKWCITSIREEQTYLFQNGDPRKITFNISLKKYGEDNPRGLKGII